MYLHSVGDFVTCDSYQVLGVTPIVLMRVTLPFGENCGARPSSLTILRASLSRNHISFLCFPVMSPQIDVVWLRRDVTDE